MKKDNLENLLLVQLSIITNLELEFDKLIPLIISKSKNPDFIDICKSQQVTSISNANKIKTLKYLEAKDLVSENEEISCLLNSTYKYLESGEVVEQGLSCFLEKINAYKSATYNNIVKISKTLKIEEVYDLLQSLSNHNYNMMDRYQKWQDDQTDFGLLDE